MACPGGTEGGRTIAMQCLILGGAGFIGSHVVDALVARGHGVRVLDLKNVSKENLKKSMDFIEIREGDFHNVKEVAPALKGMDVVVHLVCTTLPGPSNENPAYDVESNVVGTLNLLDKAVELGVNKVVFASSGGTVYGIPGRIPIPETHPTEPICSYGITKLAIEKYLALYGRLRGLGYVVLRLGNPYGERQRMDSVQGAVAVFLGKTLRGEPITIWGDGSVSRDYFYIDDLVSAFVRTIESECPSQVYNIGSGRAYSLIDILSAIRAVTGMEPKVSFAPGRSLDVPVNCLDVSRARADLNWSPETSLSEGMKKMWIWMKSRYRAGRGM